MAHLDNKLEWCINKAKKEGRKHRGLRQIEPDEKLASEFMAKAEHNLGAMLYLIKGNFMDWAISASFYSMYHCLLAILAKHGYESRNQECTMTAVEHLIQSKKLKLEVKWLRKIASFGSEASNGDLISLREEFQYSAKTEWSEKKLQLLAADTKEFIELVKAALKE